MNAHTIEGLEAAVIAALVVHGAVRSTSVRHVVTAPARRRAKRRARVFPTDQVEIDPPPPVLVDQADVDAWHASGLPITFDEWRATPPPPFPPTLGGLAAELQQRRSQR